MDKEKISALMRRRNTCFRWKIVYDLLRENSRTQRANIRAAKSKQEASWDLSKEYSRPSSAIEKSSRRSVAQNPSRRPTF